MVKEWQVEVKKKSFTLINILDELAQRIKDINESGRKVDDFEKAKELYVTANYNSLVIDQDGSRGAHNYDYAVSVLDKSLKMARESRNILTAGH